MDSFSIKSIKFIILHCIELYLLTWCCRRRMIPREVTRVVMMSVISRVGLLISPDQHLLASAETAASSHNVTNTTTLLLLFLVRFFNIVRADRKGNFKTKSKINIIEIVEIEIFPPPAGKLTSNNR